MDPNTFPTKGNLILAKNALALSKQGFDLMDKKRNILIRELMELISEASDIQNQIDETFSNAYQALQKANIQMGIHQVEQIAKAVPVENSIRIKRRSVMGTEIPKVEYEKKKQAPAYSFYHTRMSLDEACQQFEKVKESDISCFHKQFYRFIIPVYLGVLIYPDKTPFFIINTNLLLFPVFLIRNKHVFFHPVSII